VDYLSKDGLLLVIFVSVQILNKNLSEAKRVIEMAFKCKLPDAICRYNLRKLQALIAYLEKKYFQAV
jgi:hypothetical protein